MKLGVFYDTVVVCGIEQDPRIRKSGIASFPDSGLLCGDSNSEVRKIMVGIDVEAPELLIADRIRAREGLDLVVSHHPEGKPYAALYAVMGLQVDVLKQAGLAQETARELMEERMREVARRLLPQNHTRAVDAALLLNMPFACAHTPADNHVYRFIQDAVNARKPGRVEDIIDILMEHEEYRLAQSLGAGPRVVLGNPKKPAGKVMVDMTGGTEGHVDVFEKLYKAGIRTLVCMHVSEEHFRKVKDTNLNVIIAGHISSDTLGVNLLLDNVERKSGECFEVIACSGFKRIRRR